MEVTVYLLDTSDSIYQNKRCNAKYSELFKCFCVKAATGHEIDDIAFKTGDYGKPLLYRPYNKHLNISHTDGFSVCIVSDMNVGIDIEKVEPIDLTIAKNYFAQAEYQYIMKDNNEQAQLNRFFEVWTLKECYIKMLGTGIYKALDSFSITPEGHTYKMIELVNNQEQRLSSFHKLLFNQYALSIILETANQDIKVNFTDITHTFNAECIC